MDCPFCKIVAGELPSYKVYEDDLVYAFLDIGPTTKGHTLVVPKKHTENTLTIDEETLTRVMKVAKKIALEYKQSLGAEGFNFWNNTGAAAEQVVFHYHLHLLPRYAGDNIRISIKHDESIDVEAVHKQITSSKN